MNISHDGLVLHRKATTPVQGAEEYPCLIATSRISGVMMGFNDAAEELRFPVSARFTSSWTSRSAWWMIYDWRREPFRISEHESHKHMHKLMSHRNAEQEQYFLQCFNV